MPLLQGAGTGWLAGRGPALPVRYFPDLHHLPSLWQAVAGIAALEAGCNLRRPLGWRGGALRNGHRRAWAARLGNASASLSGHRRGRSAHGAGNDAACARVDGHAVCCSRGTETKHMRLLLALAAAGAAYYFYNQRRRPGSQTNASEAVDDIRVPP